MTFEKTRPFLALAALFAVISSLPSCGGGPTTPTQVEAETPARAVPETGPDPEDGSSTPAKAAGASCAETGCFPCGEGTCPRGSYCDATSEEKPACAWLGDCGEIPGCTCLTRILGSSCSCEESDGASRIHCSG